MTLETSGVYSIGDELKVLSALELPFSQYSEACITGCMNDLEKFHPGAAGELVKLLAEFETAKKAESSNNMAQSGGGKTLVKADVLEWEIDHSQVGGGPQKEVKRIRKEIALYMSGCSCLGGALSKYTNDNGDNMMYVYRS